jgi:oligopeptide transport system substrate-binding protein
MKRRLAAAALAAALALSACTNNPYPDADDARAIFYSAFDDPPKTLDPQVAYSVNDHLVIGDVYDTLLEYHYLKRPYTLMPGLLEEIPHPEPLPDGRIAYTLRLREGARFHADPAFAHFTPGVDDRPVRAEDIAFAFQRIGDPAVGSPVFETLVKIDGLREFAERLEARRKQDPEFGKKRIDEQYREADGIAGVEVLSERELRLVLDEPYPQIRFWLAMPFTTPVPWEAVAYYDGLEGRDHFAEHAVGTGPFRIARYDKTSLIALERAPNWYGLRHPDAPGAVYPSEGEPGDEAAGYLGERAGKPLPFLDRVEFRREKETIPYFNKFLQGYYDISSIPQESFDKFVQEGTLSPEMQARGMKLAKSVGPTVYYIGFNMDDPTVGAPAGERGRKLRQAMSLVTDAEEYLRVFANSRGIPAQSPIPPGIFGYDPEYKNPFRTVDPERAAQLLVEAGYPGGIDPETGRPLRLTFDTPSTDTRSLLTFQFLVDAWRRLGLDVEVAATSYNQFQDKVRRGAFQIFQFGWVADYPDPENFLFLLWSGMARSKNGGPNTANFQNAEYDALFDRMKVREDDEERLELVREMRELLERERPWIELFHPEGYALYHGWVAPPKPAGMAFAVDKYRRVEPDARAELREAWNRPIRWPAYALAAATVLVVLPGIATWRRERR